MGNFLSGNPRLRYRLSDEFRIFTEKLVVLILRPNLIEDFQFSYVTYHTNVYRH